MIPAEKNVRLHERDDHETIVNRVSEKMAGGEPRFRLQKVSEAGSVVFYERRLLPRSV